MSTSPRQDRARRSLSVARQLLLLQCTSAVLLIAVAAVAVVLQDRQDARSTARAETLAVTGSVATSPSVLEAARSADPSARLQPFAEQVRRRTGVDFVVVMAPDRTRWSHPDPAQLGRPFLGTIAPALAGRTFTETYTGTLGPSIRAVAPVRAADGRIVALVSAGITTRSIGAQVLHRIAIIGAATLAVLALALGAALLLSRRLRRQTHGLSAAQLRHTYETHEAVLHAVREGLLVVDGDGVVRVVNDEARRLLDLPDLAGDVPVADLGLPPALADAMTTGRNVADEVHLTGDRVLLVNQGPVTWEGRRLGTVTTLRDHTELQTLTGELDAVRGLTDSLHAQAHEAANRLHAVVALIETGRADEAVSFATSELEVAQELMDRLVVAVEEPVVAALLLGKVASASERGIELRITNDTGVGMLPLPPRDLVTVLGNLVDNAMDAASEGPPPRWVEVSVRTAGGRLVVRVHDSGPGLDPEQAVAAFSRGWSTKPASGPAGRGLGLALVGQVVRRHGGTVDVRRGVGAVFEVTLPLTDPVVVGARP